jgi:hypothetical protein
VSERFLWKHAFADFESLRHRCLCFAVDGRIQVRRIFVILGLIPTESCDSSLQARFNHRWSLCRDDAHGRGVSIPKNVASVVVLSLTVCLQWLCSNVRADCRCSSQAQEGDSARLPGRSLHFGRPSRFGHRIQLKHAEHLCCW